MIASACEGLLLLTGVNSVPTFEALPFPVSSACRIMFWREPEVPASHSSVVNVESVPEKLACAAAVNGAETCAGGVAAAPLAFAVASSVQFSPVGVWPISLVEAATVAPPANAERSAMNCWPADPLARSQA